MINTTSVGSQWSLGDLYPERIAEKWIAAIARGVLAVACFPVEVLLFLHLRVCPGKVRRASWLFSLATFAMLAVAWTLWSSCAGSMIYCTAVVAGLVGINFAHGATLQGTEICVPESAWVVGQAAMRGVRAQRCMRDKSLRKSNRCCGRKSMRWSVAPLER
jgi:hypothetical protein